MWEICNSFQIISFLYALALGVIYCVIYDFLRSIRQIIPHKDITVFFEDIIYFLIISILTFIFLMATTNGSVRSYILVGISFGFCLSNIFISRYIIYVFRYLLKWILALFLLVSTVYYKVFTKIFEIISKITLNSLNNLKKLLKNTIELLYTNRK